MPRENKIFLSNDKELKAATEKFYLKNLEFEDSRYIIKIKKFIDAVIIKSKDKFETPYWYNVLFINQRLRLRFKEKQMLSFLKEFLAILLTYKEHSFINYIKILFTSLIFLLRYLPFLLIKKIINFSK